MPHHAIKNRSHRQRITNAKRAQSFNSAGSTKGKGAVQVSKIIAVFTILLVASLFAFRLCDSYLSLSFDEGIYLYGAERLLSGQHIYRDFFVFTGPGTLWLFDGLFKLFGPSFAAAHAALALEIGLITLALYGIAARSGKKLVGLAAGISFLTLLVPFSHHLYVNHRWDSCCCIVLSVACLLYHPEKRSFLFLSGTLAGIAAVFTPPTLWVALAVAICLALKPPIRKAAWLISAVCIPLVIAVAVLALRGDFSPMLTSFQWAGAHYRQANSVPYGFLAGIPNAAHPRSRMESLLFEIPALLPAVSLLLLAALRFKSVRISYPAILLAAAGLGMAASCYPRWSADQLLFAAPLFLSLLFLLVSVTLQPNFLRFASIAISAAGCLVILGAVTDTSPAVPVITQLGEVACQYRDQPNVTFATSVIQPGNGLFVYPYQPIWYALTGGINPTRFNFLQPGMMTLNDEDTALRELKAHPPEWVIWHKLTSQTVLAIWPHSDPTTLRFSKIEAWIRNGYSQVRPPNPNYRYAIALFRRKGA